MLLAAHASVVIASCYNGYTCTNTTGEEIRLACIDASEMKATSRIRHTSMQAAAYDNTSAVQSRKYLNRLVAGMTRSIRRITTDPFGRTIGELFVDGINIGQQLVENRHAEVYWKYARQCSWAKI